MEVRQFAIHKNLLRDVISRQAGTVDKAVLELVMNLIEAGATRGDIILTPEKLIVTDDGRGFSSRKEIEEAFEVFGKSDERAEQEKRWGLFQIGRGQAMAFGRTTYRTRTFRMTVDLENCTTDINYVLEEDLEDVAGCVVTVDFYNSLNSYQFSETKNCIERAVKYVETPINLNGIQINVSPLFEQWDEITDEAYIKYDDLDDDRVKVYNLGVFVENTYIQGASGLFVSRKQLKLNFPRNQVISDCPVYIEICKKFTHRVGKAFLKRKTFKADDVMRVFERVENNDYSHGQVRKLPLFKDTNGKKWSLQQISEQQHFSLDVNKSRMADVAMQLRKVVVFDCEHARKALNAYDNDDAAAKLIKHIQRITYKGGPTYLHSDVLYRSLPSQDQILFDGDLEKPERTALRILRATFDAEYINKIDLHNESGSYRVRELSLGESPAYAAWTDGSSYIVFDRSTFNRNLKSVVGWTRILSTLCHEYAHEDITKTHDGEFYERFHDSLDYFMRNLYAMYAAFVREMRDAGIQLAGHLEREADVFTIE